MSGNIVSVDEESLRGDIRNLVRKTVEDTINALLDEEASELVGAGRYEKAAGREAYRSGHYKRKLVTTGGEVELRVPKLRGATFQTAMIERYRRRETSVEEAIVEMYLARVSTRRIEDVSKILWGAPVSSGTVSNLNERAFASIEAWRTRPLDGDYPYLFVDGIYLKRSWGGSYENVAVLVAIGVNSSGEREVIECSEGYSESADSWKEFFSWLRGARPRRRAPGHRRQVLRHARRHRGGHPDGPLPALRGPLLPQRAEQDAGHQEEGARAHAQGDTRPGVQGGLRKEGGRGRRLARRDAAKVVRAGVGETLTYTGFPPEHWRRIRTNNGIERVKREIRRRTRVVGTFPDGNSALMLVTARLKYIAENEWGKRRYLDMAKLEEMDELEKAEG